MYLSLGGGAPDPGIPAYINPYRRYLKTLTKLGFKEDTREQLKDLAAGAIAGAVANLAVKPIDVVADTRPIGRFLDKKLSVGAQNNVLKQVKEMYQISKEQNAGRFAPGVRGFYSGSVMKTLKVAPFSALSYMLYGLAKRHFDKT
jgi:hypothetical protein